MSGGAPQSQAPPPSAKDRVNEIHQRGKRRGGEYDDDDGDEELLALKRRLVPRLAKRAYHLEAGNTWRQDWVQYQRNTHPVFGLCLHHEYHPIGTPQRVVILVGSIGEPFFFTFAPCGPQIF